jgi:hypothetical protein
VNVDFVAMKGDSVLVYVVPFVMVHVEGGDDDACVYAKRFT